MSRGLMDTVRAANRTRRPEDSIPLRVAILAAVITGVVALAAEHAVSVGTAMVVLAVLPFAYWVSYVRRAKDNWAIKLAVTIGALAGVIRFFGQVKGITSLDEARFPLADIFLWVQVLHSFDLPQRKDLNFSLGSSLALMAVAGSVSQDFGFALYLGVYFVFVIAALTLGYRSEIADGAAGWMRPRSARGRARRPAREIVQGAAATVLAGAILFLVLPQPSGVRSFALPFNLGSGLGASSNGGITNPGFGEGVPGFRSNAANYYGFGDRMDLRVRGELSDELVMRVRASAPALWRGAVFDAYDGVSWSGDSDDPVPFVGEPPYLYPPAFRSLGPRQEITETFYVEAEQPNLVFSGGQPDEVYYEGGVSIDALGALRTDSTLTPGTVYSVISSRGAAAPAELRRTGPLTATDELKRYVELPSVPKRVTELARTITAGATNEYDAVKAIERYLRDNYRYSIDSPVPPPGRDAVDYFLFDDDVGFCEQFASATAVMLRSLGYPTRVVVGYTTGSRNPFTGYYEVHGSDAHSWVEVWFPKLGWYEFDPTFAVPPASGDVAQLVPLVRFLRFIAGKARTLFSGDVAAAAKAAFVLAAIVVTAVGVGLVWRRRRPMTRRVRASPAPFTGGAVAMAFHRYEQALRAAGRGRTASETAAELVARAAPSTPETKSALKVFERERYGYPPPRPQEAVAAADALDRMAEAARREARGSTEGSP